MKAQMITGIILVGLLLIPLPVCAQSALPSTGYPPYERATFAGGCFWCMEPAFDHLKGVLSVVAGYTGGTKKAPTYEEVSSGITGHIEAIEIVYNPSIISYKKLLEVFWHNIDPTVKDQQFCDVGKQYRSAIFTHNEEQKNLPKTPKMS